jgi:hypothetical protein
MDGGLHVAGRFIKLMMLAMTKFSNAEWHLPRHSALHRQRLYLLAKFMEQLLLT